MWPRGGRGQPDADPGSGCAGQAELSRGPVTSSGWIPWPFTSAPQLAANLLPNEDVRDCWSRFIRTVEGVLTIRR
jgi:hypothetical protein